MVEEGAPRSEDGVPTLISDTSLSPTASAASVVARIRPAAHPSSRRAASPRLDDGRATLVDVLDLVRITSTPMTVVASACKTGEGDHAHVAQSEDADPHLLTRSVCSRCTGSLDVHCRFNVVVSSL